MLSTMNLPEPLNCTVVPLSMKIPLSMAVAECRNTGQSTTRVKALFLAAAKAACAPVVSFVVPVQDTQALMDLVFAAAAVVVVPEVFDAAVAVVEDVEAVVELLEVVAAVVAAVVDAAVVVLAAAVLAAVVVAAVVDVVEVRVMLPLTEPVVAVVVAAVVAAAAVVLAAVVLAVVASEVVEAAVVAPVVVEVPLDAPSLELPQPTSARDMDNAQGRISRFAARLTEASACDDSSCTCAACACSVWKSSFDNFAISPISTNPRGG
jgi:hypothetical protein